MGIQGWLIRCMAMALTKGGLLEFPATSIVAAVRAAAVPADGRFMYIFLFFCIHDFIEEG